MAKYQSLEDLLINQSAQKQADRVSQEKIAYSRNDNPRDALSDWLKMAQLQGLQEERQDRAVERASKSIQDSGITPITESMGRLEKITPGATAGQGKFKSVGGLKNLIPNFLVPVAEATHILPKGAGEERASLQDIGNVKVYDSSGKQINESEMGRINEGMGMRGIFQPEVLGQALQQMGNTSLQKAKTAEAGMRPAAKEIMQERGGASSKTLEGLLKGPAAPQPNMSFEEFKKRKAAGQL